MKRFTTIAGLEFRTKGEAISHAKAIRRKYQDRPDVPFNHADVRFIVEYLAAIMPEPDELRLPEVVGIVMRHDETNYSYKPGLVDGLVLHLQYADGTERRCGLSPYKSHHARLVDALRREIRVPLPGNQCHRCGYRHGKLEQHHVKPFAEIVASFLAAEQTEEGSIAIDSRSCAGHRIIDRALAARWVKFHDSIARFESLCVGCHQHETRKQRRCAL